MKILVVGFPRSGTSLTHRIFAKHPAVKGMLFEKWALKQASNINELIKSNPMFKTTCGEKIIWEKRVTGKIGKTNENIIDYCLKWNDWFKDEAKIVQIIRHPFDSLNSLVILKKRFPRGPLFGTVYPEYLNNAVRFTNGIKSISNCMTIKYETLISNPDKTIKRLYKHCNIDPNHKHKEAMKVRRIFNHKKKDFLFKYDDRLQIIIDTFNEVEGVEYHGL